MGYKATEKFQELDTSNAYQGLTKDEYYQLLNGDTVSLTIVPKKLIIGEYITKAKKIKEKK